MIPDYDTRYQQFRWTIPTSFNMAEAILSGKSPHALALWDVAEDFTYHTYTFGELSQRARRMANAFRALEIGPGDRIGILLSQSIELVVAHLATYLIGAIAVPLFALFGEDAITYRVNDAGCSLLVTDSADWPRLATIRSQWTTVRHIIVTRGTPNDSGLLSWDTLLAEASDRFAAYPSQADDPAVIIYTSGTTGSPKGALHAHRVLLGHLPGVVMPHQGFPQTGDAMWTPADWAWIGGLLDVLLPSLYFGVPVVAFRPRKFDPERTLELLRRFPIRNIFFPPTALRLLRTFIDHPADRISIRTLASGGESLGADMINWIQTVFGVTPAEFYGQTEANLLVANAPDVFPPIPGSMGRAVYGHRIQLINESGETPPRGEVGEITVALPDPVAFLRYWNRPEATAAKTAGGRVHTGDLARQDDQGHFYFVGRTDDIINSAGYRLGPAEIESVIATHPAVALNAVIGKPDPIRGEIVKAYIVPKSPAIDRSQVIQEIQALVRQRLGAHEYPREIEFVETLPMTTTGKIQRNVLRQRESS